jgi:hypothetical protein
MFYFLSIERNEEDSLEEEMLRGRQEEEKEKTKRKAKQRNRRLDRGEKEDRKERKGT